MGIVPRYLPHYTVKDYEKWQGDWELVEGIPYALASPSFKHQKIVGRLFSQLEEALSSCKGCDVAFDLDWIVSEDTVFRPDVVIFCGEVRDRLTITPKVIFEVVSPASAQMDERVKFTFYEREGVEIYVLVYPDMKMAKIYKNSDRGFRKIGETKDILNLCFGDCSVNVDLSKVWIE